MTIAKSLAFGSCCALFAIAAPSGCAAPSGSPVVPVVQCGQGSNHLSGSAVASTSPAYSLFCNASRPSNIAQATQSIELGLRFKSDADGFVDSVKFYKDPGNTGIHTGTLWTSTGIALATTTFTNETDSGWQSADFAAPVAIGANTVYVISYHTDTGHYAGDTGYFNTYGVDNGPLHALSGPAAGGNGVFLIGPGGFPSAVNKNSNYWVDTVFSPAAVAPSTLSYSTNPAVYRKGTAVNDNTPSTSGGASTSYAVAPALPAGLSLSSTSGVISGTPSAVTARATYVVTGSNGAGSASATLDVTVNDAPPSSLVYSTSPAVYTTGTAIADNVPSSSGGAVVSWSVSPSLSSGLRLSAATGVISGTPSAAAPSTNYVVTAANSGGRTTALVNITVNDPASAPSTIFGGSQPGNVALATQSIELGLKFKADVAGSITGVRFYKDLNNTGVHTGSLWSRTGTLLATTTFSGETASGWQSASFASPVAIGANTIYVVSYHTDAGHYGGDLGYFTTSGVDNGVLHAPSSAAVGGNGVFQLGPSAFPSSVNQDSNYWVDVLFSTASTPPPPPGPLTGSALAFPGAQGGGASSVGGRGGAVYLVTNTANSGAGSLRACVEASGPRTCVFRTGGTITLMSSLTVGNPFITIAGQTAPGGGIQLIGPNSPGDPALLVTTHDVVVQYLRVRRGHNPGEVCNAMPWSCGASVEVLASPTADPHDIVFDHVSAEWSNYDAMIVLGSNDATSQPRSITVSNTIIGEALAGAGQAVGANFGGYSGQGSTTPDGMVDLDLHHNLVAGFSHRMPLLTVKSARLVNNFVYAWTYYAMRGKGLRDYINNYFKTRSVQAAPSHEIQAWTENAGNDTSVAPSFYLIGNVGPSDSSGTANWSMTALAQNESGSEASSPLATVYRRTSPMATPAGYVPITADPVATVSAAGGPMLNTARAAPYDGVGASRKLDCTGKWTDAQDAVDSRIVNAVASGTTLYGSYDYSSLTSSPQSQADLGGWPVLAAGTPCADANGNGLPDAWESYWANKLGLGSVLDPSAFSFADNYTNLEHYVSGQSPAP